MFRNANSYNSEEGNLSGLGWIKGSVSKFKSDNDIKVPHMDGTTLTIFQ